MMRYFVVVYILIAGNYIVAAQHDQIWIIGKEGPSSPSDDTFGLQILDFTKNQIFLNFTKKYLPFTENSMYSDKSGKLVYFTTGVQVFNREFDLMENGDEINKSPIQETYRNGYPSVNSMIGLPSTEDSNFVELFHIEIKYKDANECRGAKFLWTRIDKSANNGLGKVVFKNKIIYNKSLKQGGITACKHANGRDWWIPINPCPSQQMDLYLLNPSGIQLHHSDVLNEPMTFGYSTSVFSPNGMWFAHHTNGYEHSEIHIMQFDRCTGELSNHKSIKYVDPPHNLTLGAAISPNSRFLYINSYRAIWQYDLEADDIFASVDTVAIYDGTFDPYPTAFYGCQLAPDGKIYYSGWSPIYHLTYIDKPDLKGLACDVKQHALSLTLLHQNSFPQFPYYRLKEEKNSLCDSLILSVDNNDQAQILQVNYSYDQRLLIIQANDRACNYTKIELFDTQHKILSQNFNCEGNIQIPCPLLNDGVYFIKFSNVEGDIYTLKLPIIHSR